MLPLAALALAALLLALLPSGCGTQQQFCTFTNNDGARCQALRGEYTAAWCTGRARGRVGGSCVRAWVAPAAQQVFEEAEGPRGGEALAVDWAAQRGEAEHAQVALRSFNGTLDGVTVGFGGAAAAWLSARQVGQLWCNATFVSPPRGVGWWPDPLLPLDDGPRMQVAPGQTAALWLTAAVPADAEPGTHRGTATVSYHSAAGELDTVHLAISIEVWNLTLPNIADSRFTSFFQFQYQHHPFGADRPSQIRGDLQPYYGAQTEAVKEEYFALLCGLRLPPVGYGWLRSLSDMAAASTARGCTGVTPAVGPAASPPPGSSALFSIMDVSHLFGHVDGTPYNASYLRQLWAVLDPAVAALNRSGLLPSAAVYGFDEAHPKALYQPLIEQLFGAVKARYGGQLRTIAVLHFCPDLDTPIDVLIHSYADWPNGTDAVPGYGRPGQKGEFCAQGFPARWAASRPSRRYFFYHCFSPRGPSDPASPHYGAMNTFVDYPRIHNRLMPWWASINTGVSGWLYFEVSEWRFDTAPDPRVVLPPEVSQPNDGFADERIEGGFSRLHFNVNKYYGNIYGGGTTAGDGVFIYPGKRGPLSGTRAETWRDGSEDYELLARLPPAQRSELVRRLVAGKTDWRDDPVLLERTRREAAAQLMGAEAGVPPRKTDDEPLSQLPYSLLWNSPWPSTCARKNAAVDWVALRITTNANTTDNGAAVSTFQPEHTGLVPKFVTGPGCAPHKPCVAWRGGIPQKVNMSRHIAKWRADIEKYLPDPTATGVAALDWEDWKPSFESNRGGTYKEYEIYINASVADVRARHPGWSYERQYEQAKVEFEAAAKALFTTTIDVAKTMRPHMSWGFYGFPATCGCDHDGQIRDRCSTPNANDELMWLWSHVSGLFPSIYIPTANATANRLFVDCIMRESQRVSREAGGLPVWVYAQYLSEATHQQLSPSDTVSEYARAQAWGAAGAIMWGSTAGARTLCNSTAGLTPWLSQNAHVFASVVARAERCGDERCHSRGRCVELPTPRCQCFTGSIQSNCSDVSIG